MCQCASGDPRETCARARSLVSGYALKLDVDFEDGIPLGRSGVGQDGICLGRLYGAEQDVGAAKSADVLRHRPEQPLAGGTSRQAGAR